MLWIWKYNSDKENQNVLNKLKFMHYMLTTFVWQLAKWSSSSWGCESKARGSIWCRRPLSNGSPALYTVKHGIRCLRDNSNYKVCSPHRCDLHLPHRHTHRHRVLYANRFEGGGAQRQFQRVVNLMKCTKLIFSLLGQKHEIEHCAVSM